MTGSYANTHKRRDEDAPLLKPPQAASGTRQRLTYRRARRENAAFTTDCSFMTAAEASFPGDPGRRAPRFVIALRVAAGST